MPLNGKKKYFKLFDCNLHLYNKETDRKAESVYNLTHWDITLEEEKHVQLKDGAGSTTHEEEFCMEGLDGETKKKNTVFIKLESSDQLGCELKMNDLSAMEELFKVFERVKETF